MDLGEIVVSEDWMEKRYILHHTWCIFMHLYFGGQGQKGAPGDPGNHGLRGDTVS